MLVGKKILFFVFLTLFFTGVIFFTNLSFNKDLDKNIEESYIEPTINNTIKNDEIDNYNDKYVEIAKNIIKNTDKQDKKTIISQKIESKKINTKKFNSAKIKAKIKYIFIPSYLSKDILNDKDDFNNILHNQKIYSFLGKITIVFFDKRDDVRGKMKNRQIRIFDPKNMDKDELIAIFIHEFSHYIDIYFLDGLNDISNQFYNISWNSTKVIKQGLTQNDFVSGYSMTNKYEDFAESLTYYVLHNRDFLEKSIKSDILRKKYNFFNLVLFKSEIFKNTDFSKNNKIRKYYRDITKIHFSRKNFLQYLKKSI